MSKVFSRNDFLVPPSLTPFLVHIDTLDADVYIKKMSALDQDSFEQEMVEIDEAEGKPKIRRKLEGMQLKYLVRVLCDKDGMRLFKDDEYHILGKWTPDVISELYAKAVEVNTVKETKKNLKTT